MEFKAAVRTLSTTVEEEERLVSERVVVVVGKEAERWVVLGNRARNGKLTLRVEARSKAARMFLDPGSQTCGWFACGMESRVDVLGCLMVLFPFGVRQSQTEDKEKTPLLF